MPKNIKLKSMVRCPVCKYTTEVVMSDDACQILYDCEECGANLKPKPGDCCIFCSYGSEPCPAMQKERLSRQS